MYLIKKNFNLMSNKSSRNIAFRESGSKATGDKNQYSAEDGKKYEFEKKIL